ncbi:hypothetical protein HY948_01600 [Candidatus Gottesmanbacteria bacterium]|nr:hypothetical protein [Candidatus Gottesmanbacteria bacterium]
MAEPGLEDVTLQDGRVLPGLHLADRAFYIAFGDADVPNGTRKVQDRWQKKEEYLRLVAEGFNSLDGEQFAFGKLGVETIEMFPYRADEPAYVAPCLVKESKDGNEPVVVIYSFGPK